MGKWGNHVGNWQKQLDESGFIGTIRMELPKAYDCLPHNLMVAKLEAYVLAKESLQLISDHLSCRKQRTKIGSAYSDWTNSLAEFLKALYWDLYFSIFFLITFSFSSDICNFADDNTLYSHGSNLI